MKTISFRFFEVPIEKQVEDESGSGIKLFGVQIEAPVQDESGTRHGLGTSDQDPPVAAGTSRQTVNIRRNRVELDLPRQLPIRYKEKIESMGGRDVKLVIQKQLYISDVNNNLCRLTLPKMQILDHDFLDEEEKRGLQEKKGELKVKIIEPSMKESELVTKKWPQDPKATGWSYALMGDWQRVRKSCRLLTAEKDAVQIWSFRYDGDKLGMVLLKYETSNLSSSATTS